MRFKQFRLILATTGLMLAAAVHSFEVAAPPVAAQGTLQVAFTPWDDIEKLITGEIDDARQQVLVQAYLLTSRKISGSLIAAKRRGIDVRILADAKQHGNTPSSKLDELVTSGVPVWLETKYQNAHNKIILIDAGSADSTLITGSFNFTWTAQHKNSENILIVRKNRPLAMRYLSNWERHHAEALPYKN